MEGPFKRLTSLLTGLKSTKEVIVFNVTKEAAEQKPAIQIGVAVIAPWFCLRLPSCAPGSNPKPTIYAFLILNY